MSSPAPIFPKPSMNKRRPNLPVNQNSYKLNIHFQRSQTNYTSVRSIYPYQGAIIVFDNLKR